MIIKMHEWTNDKEKEELNKFPSFRLRCRLRQLLKERGIKLKELSAMTGIRLSALSELANTTRSTINIPHLTTVAMALRITDLNELFEFLMEDDVRKQFTEDQHEIKKNGILPDQEEFLASVRKERKPRKKPTDKK
ncbi:helix-turn-helix transcriptional regulator [Bacillus sp. Bos-x628]|uniref:helix-turn-helix domain-containing protein n=1 Tax=Bacillus maqinnsis TaxID=3229854 RepID=UPI00338EFD47